MNNEIRAQKLQGQINRFKSELDQECQLIRKDAARQKEVLLTRCIDLDQKIDILEKRVNAHHVEAKEAREQNKDRFDMVEAKLAELATRAREVQDKLVAVRQKTVKAPKDGKGSLDGSPSDEDLAHILEVCDERYMKKSSDLEPVIFPEGCLSLPEWVAQLQKAVDDQNSRTQQFLSQQSEQQAALL